MTEQTKNVALEALSSISFSANDPEAPRKLQAVQQAIKELKEEKPTEGGPMEQ